MQQTDLWRDIRKSLGLVLVFVGMQLNTAIKNVFIGVDFSIGIMFASAALLLVDTKNFSQIKMSAKMKGLFVFQIVLFLFALLSSKSTFQLISFHLYLLALIFALSTNKDYIEFKTFPAIMFWFSGFIGLVILYQATEGFTKLITTYANTSKLWLENGGDPITMSRALGINFISCLFYKNKNTIAKLATPVFVCADVIGMFSFSSRSVILCSLLTFLIWYFCYYTKKLTFKKITLTILVIALLYIIASNSTYLARKINTIYESMINGIQTLFNNDRGITDPSAQTRNIILQETSLTFNKNFIRNFFLGLGYNYTYVDRPIYQIFFDFGIIFFIVYAYYLLAVPIQNLCRQLKRKTLYYNAAFDIVTFISLQALFDQFLTGLPYYYFLWTPTIFILFSIENTKDGKTITS